MKNLVLTPSTHELPPGWSVDQFRDVVQRAADKWTFPNIPCGVKVTVAETSPAWRATEDGTNLIVFRGLTWCHNERCGPQSTFPLRATGMTTTHPKDAIGRAVVEADVEINGVAFRYGGNAGAVPESEGVKWSVSLESVLVHEIGHVLGLPDACGTQRRASGRPITSDCASGDRLRVMFPTGLRDTLAPEDVRQLCLLHPADGGGATGTVSGEEIAAHPKRQGCACDLGATVGDGSAWLLMVIAIVATFISRRMRPGRISSRVPRK